VANTNLAYTRLAERNVSFQLLRTNPKLTTNLKLTIDSEGSLWFNSIDANELLANQKYKRFAINERSSHEVNIYRFYDNGKTPSTTAYQIGSTINKSAVAKDLKDQYDFDLYTSGAKYLTSRQYSEKFSYFAPIYLDDATPNKFVIFKVPGSSNYTAGEGKSKSATITIDEFATDLFKNATIVKVFDMSPESKIGTYLSNIKKNPMFNSNPLYVNYKTGGYSLYRGASITTGTYVELPEQLSTVFNRALPLTKVEQFVTQGFERNNIVHPKILNLEFLFNDDTSNPYEFNRYFGFYCNDIDLETFEIDIQSMYDSKLNISNSIDLTTGLAALNFNNSPSVIKIEESTGNIYIGGNLSTVGGYAVGNIVKIKPNGKVDTSFVQGTGFNGKVSTIEVDTDGIVYVGGQFTEYNGSPALRFIKLNSDGSINSTDLSFNQSVASIVFTDDQKMYVGGKFSTYTYQSNPAETAVGLIRLSITGEYDSAFTIGSGFTGLADKVKKILLTPAGKIIAIGSFTDYYDVSGTASEIVQINEDGTVDTSFNSGTGFPNNSVNDAIIDPLGRIYVAGNFGVYNSTSVAKIARLNVDGTLDTTFISKAAGSTINKLGLDINGLLYALGDFDNYNGVPAKGIVRLLTDGQIDYTFNSSTGFNSTANLNALTINNADVYIGGEFSSFETQSAGGIINLSIIQLDNDQILPLVYSQADDISFALTNSTGVKLRAMNLTQDLSDLALNRTSKDTLFFPYLKTKNGFLHLINSNDWNQIGTLAEFKIDDTSFDLGTAFGPSELIVQETAALSTTDSKSTVALEIVSNPSHLDTLRIYHPTGSKIDPLDSNGKFDELVFTSGYLASTVAYSLSYVGSESVIYVNSDRDLSQISQAISDIVDSIRDTSISGVVMDSRVFLQTNEYGDAYGELKVKYIPISSKLSIKINGVSTTTVVYADGGFLNKPHVVIASGNISKLTPMLDDIVIRTNKDWSKISRICKSADLIKDGLSSDDRKLAIANYFNNATIELYDDESVNVVYNKIEVRKLFKPSVGVLSLFEITDFNFTTYSSDYSRTLTLDLYKDFYIPENTKIIDFTNYSYQIVGAGTVVVNETEYSGNGTIIWQNDQTLTSYTVPIGTAILIKSNQFPNSSTTRLDVPYYDETSDALDFIGPFSIKADHTSAAKGIATYPYREKFLANNLTSEYHVYLENYIPDFASDGRVIPYINKWGLIDSTDSRQNPYRLNSDIMFGKDNFGPSHRDTSPTPEKLTHEWFYIESDFGYSNDATLVRNNYSYFDQSLNISELTTSADYFETYFTYLPIVDGVQVGRPQYRYSSLNRNSFTNQYETLFKGSMFRFYELNSDGLTIANTQRFNDYKFSVIMKPIKEDPTTISKPINYRVIENVDSKSITVVIEVSLGYKAQLPDSIFIDGWSTQTFDMINQTTLFAGAFTAEPVTYQIDTTINSLTEGGYYGYINGASVINANIGDTVQITYNPSNPVAIASTIIATQGSPLYDAVMTGQISSGDKLGPYIYAQVDAGIPITLPTGTYQAVRIQANFEDTWTHNALTAGTGEISSDSGYYNMSTSSLLLNKYNSVGDNQSTFIQKFVTDEDIISVIYGINEESCQFGPDPGTLGLVIDTYQFDVSPISGAIVSLPSGDPVVVKARWVIPNPLDVYIPATTEFTVSHNTAYTDSMFGDYRIEFNHNEVSNITHSFLYFAKDKKYNNKQDAYSTIKLSRGVDLSPNGIYVNPSTTLTETIQTELLYGIGNSDVLADSEINRYISNDFAPIYVIKPGEKDILVQLQSISSTTLTSDLINPLLTSDGIDGAIQDKLNVTSSTSQLAVVTPITIGLSGSISYNYFAQAVPFGTTSNWTVNTNHFQIFGGKNYFDKVFENLSFAKFVQLLRAENQFITWETYSSGLKIPYQTTSIEIIQADEITKSTIVSLTPETVTSGQINQVAGFNYSEVPSQEYSINRYSAEYEVITNPIAGFKYNFSINGNDLSGANICLNPYIDNFFVIPDFEYVKYSKTSILDLENSQKYSSVYPYINETPIDRTNFNALSSSWDYGYHFEYSNKQEYTKVPGTRRVHEDYSFVSKLLNVPIQFTVEEFTSVLLSNAAFTKSQASEADIVYSRFGTEIRFKMNTYSLITKHLSNNGLRSEFEKFFKYSNGSAIITDQEFLGDLTLTEYLTAYSETNLIKLYQVDSFEFYELDDREILGNEVLFEQVGYDLLGDLGYDLIRSVRINNTKSKVIEGTILIKPNTGVKIVPKIKIKFI
jgi:hypothetical protein